MDMEYELHALRNQLAEKSKRSLELQKEVAPMFTFIFADPMWKDCNSFFPQLPNSVGIFF